MHLFSWADLDADKISRVRATSKSKESVPIIWRGNYSLRTKILVNYIPVNKFSHNPEISLKHLNEKRLKRCNYLCIESHLQLVIPSKQQD